MERKLVRQGRNALTVTLPAKWLQARDLKPGDVVHIAESNHDLRISTSLRAMKTSVELDVSGEDMKVMWHRVIAKYLDGYDRIVMRHDDMKSIQVISTVTIGMVLEEHAPTRSVLRSIISIPEDNFEMLMRRSGFMLLQLARMLEPLTRKEVSISDIEAQERLLDSNILYCIRYLNKYEDRQHAYRYFLICSTMEEAGDGIKNIAKHIGRDASLARTIAQGVESYNTLLFKNDFKRLYAEMKSFRNRIGTKTFSHGLAFALAETLYNFIGYVVEQK